MSATDEGFTNQRRTEPMPATPPHDVPDTAPGEHAERPPVESGTVSSVGPRESQDQGDESGQLYPPGSAGQSPEQTSNTADLTAGTTQGPHDAGRPGGEALGEAHRAPGSMGDTPEQFEVDTDEGARSTQQAIQSNDTTSPGDPRSAPAPSYLAAEGTSEESGQVQGVRVTAIAQPGKPDGETDTRM